MSYPHSQLLSSRAAEVDTCTSKTIPAFESRSQGSHSDGSGTHDVRWATQKIPRMANTAGSCGKSRSYHKTSVGLEGPK